MGTLVNGATTTAETHDRPVTLVWIDSREARILPPGGDRLVRLVSDVPARHRSVGHVRHDPVVRHGGGGSQSAGEPRRLEHLERFLARVVRELPGDADVEIVGPGPVPIHLERRLREADRHRAAQRVVHTVAAGPMTDRQLLARSRELAGETVRRQTAGAYRWLVRVEPAFVGLPTPHRVVAKPPRDPDR